MSFEVQCPLPVEDGRVRMAHGGGGRATHRLLEGLFLPLFRNEALDRRHDAAVVEVGGARVAMTTDSYVVRPRFFPGGDIGSLAVHGTVNDLAMAGARPLFLSAAFVLEEGLAVEELHRLAVSMAAAARASGVQLVTGDTKVVERGKGDGLFVTTTGLGLVEAPEPWLPEAIRPGDAVLVSGDLGRHGIAIMASREGLEFETRIESDSAPLWPAVEALLRAGVRVRCLRDLTRGGLSSALVELAEAAGLEIEVDEPRVPVHEEVRGACELLGLDVLAVANEGRMVAFVAPEDAGRAVDLLREVEVSAGTVRVGAVTGAGRGGVRLRTALGTLRPLDMLSGEQLPRIC